MKTIRPLITLLIVAATGCATAPVAQLQPSKAVSNVETPFPVPIIELRGDPAAIGSQHAEQLGQPIRQLFGDYFNKYFQSNLERNIALMTASAFSPYISAGHRAEIHALA